MHPAMPVHILASGIAADILINEAGITNDASLSKKNRDAALYPNHESIFNVAQPFVEGTVDTAGFSS